MAVKMRTTRKRLFSTASFSRRVIPRYSIRYPKISQARIKNPSERYGYGSIIPFLGVIHIHKSQLFWCELQGYYWFWHIRTIWILGQLDPTEKSTIDEVDKGSNYMVMVCPNSPIYHSLPGLPCILWRCLACLLWVFVCFRWCQVSPRHWFAQLSSRTHCKSSAVALQFRNGLLFLTPMFKSTCPGWFSEDATSNIHRRLRGRRVKSTHSPRLRCCDRSGRGLHGGFHKWDPNSWLVYI